jgi:hypothetical protein
VVCGAQQGRAAQAMEQGMNAKDAACQLSPPGSCHAVQQQLQLPKTSRHIVTCAVAAAAVLAVCSHASAACGSATAGACRQLCMWWMQQTMKLSR